MEYIPLRGRNEDKIMALKDWLKAEARQERAKLKEMSFQDKLWYIWEYYKIHMLIGCIILFFFYILGSIFYQKSFTTRLFYVVMNDPYASFSDYEGMSDGFKARMGYGNKERVDADTSLHISFGNSTSELDYASLAKITAIVASQDLDLMITNRDAVEHYAANDGLLDLEEVLPADLWELVKEDVYEAQDSSGAVFSAAVNLEHSNFRQKSGTQMEEPCFCLISNSKRIDTAIEFLRYLYEE